MSDKNQKPDKDILQEYETVIGLEVHAELSTSTKLFSSSPNSFGDEPNVNIDPVCLGLPGSLPVLNKKAVELGIRVGLALNSEISSCTFARKNYFYPDMPKNYQTSQYDQPLNSGGALSLPSGSEVRITRAHLEEDSGKINHIGGAGRIHEASYSLIDYNRAGVPLIEIVSEPDIRSGEEAKEYVGELRDLLIAVGASDGKMEEGSLRVDCNVSVRKKGDKELGTRCEIKNVNSLRSLEKAIEYESRRQAELLESSQTIIQETRHWDEDGQATHSLRAKGGDTDYRYFPDPDLVLLDPDQEWVDSIKADMPDLPSVRRENLAQIMGKAAGEMALVVSRGLDGMLAEAVLGGADPHMALNHAEQHLSDRTGKLTTDNFIELLKMQSGEKVSSTQAKTILQKTIEDGMAPSKIAEEMGFEAADAGEMEGLANQLISDNPEEWRRFCDGEEKLQEFFVGMAMKATKGKADGKMLTSLLKEKKSQQ